MFCSSCGSKLKDGAKFCAACGTAVAMVTPAEAVKEAVTEVVAPVIDTVESVATATNETVNAVVEEKEINLKSEVDTSLDAAVSEALLETPKIPEPEVQFEEKQPVNETAPVEVTPVVPEVKPVEVAPVVPEAKPVEVAPVVPEVKPVEVAPVVPEVKPVEVAPVVPEAKPVEVAPVAPAPTPVQAAPVVNAPAEEAPVKTKKVREAFKFFSLLGAIAVIVGCFLDLHSFEEMDGEVVVRVDKLWEFSYGQVMVVLMGITILLLLFKLSSFAFGTILATAVSYGLFVAEVYFGTAYTMDDTKFYKSFAERSFSLGIGSFVIWAGLVLAIFGLFIKFGKKKPLFKI